MSSKVIRLPPPEPNSNPMTLADHAQAAGIQCPVVMGFDSNGNHVWFPMAPVEVSAVVLLCELTKLAAIDAGGL